MSEAMADAAAHNHGLGQEGAIADVNAGLVDEMIQHALARAEARGMQRAAEIVAARETYYANGRPWTDQTAVQLAREIRRQAADIAAGR